MLFLITHILLSLLVHTHIVFAGSCSATSIQQPELFGASIQSFTAYERHNYSLPAANITGLNFCNVNITYTHPGWNDTINVQVWLPLTGWNERFQGTGGSGFATGNFDTALGPAVAQGYSAVSTDGGHVLNSTTAQSWALSSPGNVNFPLLIDFASRALDDMTVLGKAVTEAYYGQAPKFSYWNGCSTGGRQGLMLAQRYPDHYDGIVATAPAINWAKFIVAEYWAPFVMNQMGVYPLQCEFNAITAAAIAACDSLDGVSDGIITSPELCHFDTHSLVGQSYNCSGVMKTHSAEAATIVEEMWTGPRTVNGSFLWYGLNPGSPLSGLANTACNANGTCSAVPFPIPVDWISLFIEKNAGFDLTKLSLSDFSTIFHQSVQQYTSIIGTDDADLSSFRDAGGKMITWHGLADQLIFPNGTIQYYERVMAADPGTHDYYRFFEAPGVGHCSGGIGAVPNQVLETLVNWVEKGVAPASLAAVSAPVNGIVSSRPLCPYPMVSTYTGGDHTQASSFQCKASTNSKRARSLYEETD